MTLLELRDAIKKTIEKAVDPVNVYTHGGRLDVAELQRYALKAPCVVVTLLGVPGTTLEGGEPVATLEFGAFIVANDRPGVRRDALAISMLQQTLGVVRPDERWGDDEHVHIAEQIRAGNLFGGTTDQKGVAIWVVTWRQGYDINALDTGTLDDLLRINSTIEISEDEDVPTAEDQVTLEAAS
jgi:hypothetical protein